MIIQTDKPIRVIPANQVLPIETQDLKVAIYARVSSQQDCQYGSLANQVGGCMGLINKYPSWELIDIYSETVSGKKTNTKTRKEFSRLFRDIKKGRVNLVLMKSISRFSRNTLTTLENLAMPQTEESRLLSFLDMVAPSTLKFYADHYLMPRIIFNSNYIKPAYKNGSRFLHYISTREGVIKHTSDRGLLPATKKQKDAIQSPIKSYPDMKTLFEYDDYRKTPSRTCAD